jgi:hypothetical protein
METRRAFAALVITLAAAAGPARAGEVVVLRIYNAAEVKSDQLQDAKALTDGILARAGIDAAWLVCSGGPAAPDDRCSGPVGNLDLVIRLQRAPAHADVDVCGTSLRPAAPDLGHVITLFVDCVQRVADALRVPVRIVLAHCLAHELGHQLLPTPRHADQGIMSPSLRALEWRRGSGVAARRVQFSEREASLMRAGIAARAAAISTACSMSQPGRCPTGSRDQRP